MRIRPIAAAGRQLDAEETKRSALNHQPPNGISIVGTRPEK